MSSTIEVSDVKHLQIKHPANIMFVGPSGSGKTYLVRDILEYHKQSFANLNKKVMNCIWAYGAWQSIYKKQLKNVNFKYIEGLPEEEDILGQDVIVIDDLMVEISKNKFILNLFTKFSHHNNQTVILLTQNLYHKGPIIRDLNLNVHYLIIFKTPNDKLQILTLAKRVYPKESGFFISAYEQATEDKHGYLMLDFKQDTPEYLRLKTNLIPSEKTNWKYLPVGFIKK
jgi:hypothetical protein